VTHKSRVIWLAILLTSPIVVLTQPPEYTLIQLQGAGVGRAFAINERGHIVGRLGPFPTFAVMWDDDGSIIARDPTPGSDSEARGINNRGQVVGYQQGLGNVLWEDGTTIGLDGTDLGDISPAAINSRGQIAGAIPTPISGERHAALWENGTIVDVGVLPGDTSSNAQAINNRGQIVGWSSSFSGVYRAFIWDNGTMSELPGLDGQEGQDTYASDINNRGQVVGSSGSRPVMWENGIPIPLDTFLPSTSGRAFGINDSGDIVGYLQSPTSSDFLPVLWQNGTPLALPTPPLNPSPGSAAVDINNRGTIIGYWVHFPGGGETVPLLWVRNARSEIDPTPRVTRSRP
jgi:Predicted integral membrane proteins containing uncharacterized repeats